MDRRKELVKWFLNAGVVMAVTLYSTRWLYNFYVSDISMPQEMHLFSALIILLMVVVVLGSAIVPKSMSVKLY